MTDRARYWRRMVTAWETSGLTQAEFCRRRGLKAVTFAWWKRQLNTGAPGRGGRGHRSGREVGTGSSKPSFVEVALPDGAGRPAKVPSPDGMPGLAYEVALPCGTSIRLPMDFDMDRAAHLIQAARSC